HPPTLAKPPQQVERERVPGCWSSASPQETTENVFPLACEQVGGQSCPGCVWRGRTLLESLGVLLPRTRLRAVCPGWVCFFASHLFARREHHVLEVSRRKTAASAEAVAARSRPNRRSDETGLGMGVPSVAWPLPQTTGHRNCVGVRAGRSLLLPH